MIRILTLCKNDRYMRAIEPLLQVHDIAVAAVCKFPEKAIEQFVTHRADLIVMDANWLNCPLSGADILQRILRFDERIKVIMVTNCVENKLAGRFQQLGARGYFSRIENNIKHIARCVKQVYYGESGFCMAEGTGDMESMMLAR